MLFQLQYLRAIAALMVVYFHGVLQLNNLGASAPPFFVLVGECGVDLFFVLSGFVMWMTTAERPISTSSFYGRRLLRIVPLYWAVTLAAALVALVAPSILKSTRFDLAHLCASLLFVPWVNPSVGGGSVIMPMVLPGWTLNYEMYFYLIFGALLALPVTFRAAALGLVLLVITGLCHLLPDVTVTRFYGNPIVFEFAAGVFLADAWLKGKLLPQRVAIIVAPLALLAMLAADHADLEDARVIVFGLPAVVTVWAFLSIDWRAVGEWRWLSAIGDASYSLYLTHVFVLAGVRVLFLHLPESLRSPSLFMAIAVVASLAVSLVVHRLFEKPVDRLLRRLLAGPSPALGPASATRS